MAMRFGRMNKRVTVLRATTTTRDAMNEPVESWAEFGTFFAEQLTQRPTESWKAGQTAAQQERAWMLRYNSRTATITPLDRIMCDGREFAIIGVTEKNRREAVEIVGIAYSEEGLNP